MRTRLLACLAVSALSLVACAAQEGDDAESQDSNVTGGSGFVDSPVLFLFDATAANATTTATTAASPKCAGAMLGDKVGVTAKACAKEGMIVGRAADKDGHGKHAKITKVITPEGADADIAVIQFDTSLGGTRALLTHLPLRDGYSVNAFAATDGKGFFSPDKGEASSVQGAIFEQTATHATILPAKGQEICDGDIGAPVCSSTGTHLAGFELRGTCGLSGLVVGRAAPAATTAANTATAKTCSGEGWKVVELGRYADFLKANAPDAFKPLVIDKPILRNFPYAPDGLWAYKSAGTVKSCAMQTTTLTPVAKATASGKITAKVSFSGLDKEAQTWARVGIAPKADPKNVTWFSTKALSDAKGTAFDQSFEGQVLAQTDGDYIVSLRTSANGGETWTDCDKTIALKVGLDSAPSETPPSTTTPQTDTPPPAGYSDPAPSGESSPAESGEADPSLGGEDEPTPKKKASDNGGCSMSHTSSGSSAISFAGMLFAFAAIARRRRR